MTKIIVDNGFSDFNNFDIFGKRFQRLGKKANIEWMRAIQKRAVFGIKRKKSGKPKRSFKSASGKTLKRSRVHRPSVKGEYPAADTGRLHRSIRIKSFSAFEGIVYTKVKYAKALEERSPDHGGRPFLTRAAKEKEPFGKLLVLDALRKSARP